MGRQVGNLSERSKRVLGEGRRIASHLGATLYAVGAASEDENEGWIAEAGLGGADKVVLVSGGSQDHTAMHDMVTALAELCAGLKPNLVLMAECADARTLAGAVAARMGAILLADATTECDAEGSLTLRERNCNRGHQRLVAASELALPVVATLSIATLKAACGQDDADLICARVATTAKSSCALLDSSTRESSLDGAEVVVTAGLGASAYLPQVDALAKAMGAARASTRTLWQEGIAGQANVVDWAQNRIAPRLYIICGASGSASHLAAVSGGTTIVVLGRDPTSPAFRAASYALIGDLGATLPAFAKQAALLAGAGEGEDAGARP